MWFLAFMSDSMWLFKSLPCEDLQTCVPHLPSFHYQLIQLVKGQNNYCQQHAFLTCSWRFLISNNSEQSEFKLEKITGVEKHAGKVRKLIYQVLIHKYLFLCKFVQSKTAVLCKVRYSQFDLILLCKYPINLSIINSHLPLNAICTENEKCKEMYKEHAQSKLIGKIVHCTCKRLSQS